MNAAGTLLDEGLIVRSFVDSFAPKATATLLKRTQHLWAYCESTLKDCKGSPLQFRESVLHKYLESMRQNCRNPTSASAFLESVRFLHGAVKLTCFQHDVCLSARCTGLAKSEMQKKRITVQTDCGYGLAAGEIRGAASSIIGELHRRTYAFLPLRLCQVGRRPAFWKSSLLRRLALASSRRAPGITKRPWLRRTSRCSCP